MYDVIVLGELLIDFAPRGVDDAGYPTMAANPGGAPCNFLAALNACGGQPVHGVCGRNPQHPG